MHVVVIGAGIVGTLSAWYLAHKGYRVTVLERGPDVAAEASAANASQLAYDSIYAMANPEFLKLIPGAFSGHDPVIRVRKPFDPKLWLWGVSFLNQCRAHNYAKTIAALTAMAEESKRLLADLRQAPGVAFGYRENGRLHIYDDAKKFEEAVRANEDGSEILSAEECIGRNPALGGRKGERIAGGILHAGSYTGNTVEFCRSLKALLSAPPHNVEFRFNADVQEVREHGRGVRVIVPHGEIAADACLVCAGAFSAQILKKNDFSMNMYPVKGCSIIMPHEDGHAAMQTNVIDIRHRIVIAPEEKGIRFSAGMYFDGWNTAHDGDLVAYIIGAAKKIMPQLDFSKPDIRTGLRPAMPSSMPVVRRVGRGNIFVNAGHGMWGWTIAPATCRQAAGMIKE